MTSPYQTAAAHSLHEIQPGELNTPPDYEGYLISDVAHKDGARIDFTIRDMPDSQSDFVVIVVPGYMGIKPMYGDFRDGLAQALNAPVATYRHPRSESGLGDFAPDELLHPDKLGKKAVLAMIDTMVEKYPEKKIVLIGHSMGGPNAVEAALRRKDKIKSVMLLGSGGLEKGQNILRIAGRLPGIISTEGKSIVRMRKKNIAKMIGQAAYHAVRNPIRTLGEGIDIGNRDLMIDEIKELQAAGIDVSAVQLQHDKFFPTHIAVRDAGNLVDNLTIIEGVDHVGPQAKTLYIAQHIAWAILSRNLELEDKVAA